MRYSYQSIQLFRGSHFFPFHCFNEVTSHFQNHFPRTLEALVLHALTPVGSEILTRKFEEMDQLISGEDQYVSSTCISVD